MDGFGRKLPFFAPLKTREGSAGTENGERRAKRFIVHIHLLSHLIKLIMKPSSVALQIALFHYPGAVAFAYVHHRHASALRSQKPPHVQHVYTTGQEASHRSRRRAFSSLSTSSSEIEMMSLVRQRHHFFKETNAVSQSMHIRTPNLWRRYLPPTVPSGADNGDNDTSIWDMARDFLSLQQQQRNDATLNDVSVEFEDPANGARQLLARCGVIIINPATPQNNRDETIPSPLPEEIMSETEAINHLTDVLSYFQSAAAAYSGSHNVKCVARAVSSVGPVGTKCPRWHADHIPVRLIMSILGPGCEYIPETFREDNSGPRIVNRQALNNLDEDDTMKANDIIVPPQALLDAESKFGKGVIKHAKEGEAVLLMGRGWEDGAMQQYESENTVISHESATVLAAVHRSPALSPDEERILLTVDLVDWN